MVAAAVIGGAVIGGVASKQGADAQADASKEGYDAQANASMMATESNERIANQNLQLQKEMAAQQRMDFSPWRDTGAQALDSLWSGIQNGDFTVGEIDLTQDPGYQFRMDQGNKALDASAAARGMLLSGAQQQAVTDYSQGMASQEYANAYAREANKKANQYNMLSGLSSQGLAASAQQAGATSQLAQTSGNILSNLGTSNSNLTTSLGNAAAQSAIDQGQARAGAYAGTATAANQGIQNWLTYQNSL